MLGVIGGIIGMIVGIVSFGFVEAVDWAGTFEETALDWQVNNPVLIKTASLLAPLLAIAGGAMARSQAMLGGLLLLISSAGMLYAFGFGAFTMFPIAMCAVDLILLKNSSLIEARRSRHELLI